MMNIKLGNFERIQGFVFDTTASNSERLNGVCILLGRDLIFLTCRHHIFEIIIQIVNKVSQICTIIWPKYITFKIFVDN